MQSPNDSCLFFFLSTIILITHYDYWPVRHHRRCLSISLNLCKIARKKGIFLVNRRKKEENEATLATHTQSQNDWINERTSERASWRAGKWTNEKEGFDKSQSESKYNTYTMHEKYQKKKIHFIFFSISFSLFDSIHFNFIQSFLLN